jgi:ribonuclease HI
LPVSLHCEFDALPFPDSSIDLVVLPHALELARDPHHTLREVERVLVPEGRVVISGFNPASLWGLRQSAGRVRRSMGFGRGQSLYLPRAGEFIGYWRLRDWLRLLGFEVEAGRFGCWRPPLASEQWLERFAWMESVGERWWPVLGSAYFLEAVKRVRGMRLIGLARQERRKPARRTGRGGQPPARQHRRYGDVMTDVVIYADGACRGNPGPGGWGAWLSSGAHEKELFGGERLTTNNRMELTAVIEALASLKRRSAVTIYTDSQYVKNGITTWIHGWKARGWKTADKKPVKNIELWQRLDELNAAHAVQWRWVKGHAGDPGNERADQLANRGIDTLT